MNINKITEIIIGCAIEVHKHLGPGLLESAYKEALIYELRIKGLFIEIEVPIPVVYKGVKLEHGYRADLIVEKCVVVELKAQEDRHDIFAAQTLTNTRLSNHKVGLLINFHHKRLVDGIKRFIF